MEKLVSIISQGAQSTRQYTDGNGQPMAFHYMDFVLTDGMDTFHAQATGKLSEALKPLAPLNVRTVLLDMKMQSILTASYKRKRLIAQPLNICFTSNRKDILTAYLQPAKTSTRR